MHEAVTAFLNAGKAFRASKNSGHVVAVESDPVMRFCVKRWAGSIGREFTMVSNPQAAYLAIDNKPVILIVGLDNQPTGIEKFIEHINNENPSTYILVYTKCGKRAYAIQEKMPRITAIVKGEGIEGLISGLEHQVPIRHREMANGVAG